MIRKSALTIALYFMQATALAISAECLDPLFKSKEDTLAKLVGNAVIYPMNQKAFDQTVTCLLAQYGRTDVAIAGFKWDITNGLLRIMAADPIQYFDVASRQEPNAVEHWLQSFRSAALWPGNRCPKLDPMTLARRSIESLQLENPSSEYLRKKVSMQLKLSMCVVAN